MNWRPRRKYRIVPCVTLNLAGACRSPTTLMLLNALLRKQGCSSYFPKGLTSRGASRSGWTQSRCSNRQPNRIGQRRSGLLSLDLLNSRPPTSESDDCPPFLIQRLNVSTLRLRRTRENYHHQGARASPADRRSRRCHVRGADRG